MDSSSKLVPLPKLAPLRTTRSLVPSFQSSPLTKPQINAVPISKLRPPTLTIPQNQLSKPSAQQNSKNTNIPLNAKDECNLTWSEFSTNFCEGFGHLFGTQELVDVTLAADGQYIQAHRLVLSVCSNYFKELFRVNPCQHPIVILKDVEYGSLKSIIEFMYLGQVQITTDKLPGLLATAQQLKVKGLIHEKTNPETASNKTTEPPLIEPTNNSPKRRRRQRVKPVTPPQAEENKKTVSYSIPMDVKVKVMRKRTAQDMMKNTSKAISINNSGGLKCSYRPSNLLIVPPSKIKSTETVKNNTLNSKSTTNQNNSSGDEFTQMDAFNNDIIILEDEVEIEDFNIDIKNEPIDIDEIPYRTD